MAGGAEYFARAGQDLGSVFAKASQENDDKKYLDWLTGQLGGANAAPAAEPTPFVLPRQASAPQPTADLGMGTADVTAPIAPPQNVATPDPMQLVEAKKQAASKLFSDPAQTLNLLVEAKKQNVSPDVNSILEFIAKQQTQNDTFAQQSAQEDKKLKAAQALESSREFQRQGMQETAQRARDRIAQASNDTRIETANIGAAASRYSTDHRPGPHAGLPQNFEHLSADDLYNLKDGLSNDLADLQAPTKSGYDGYDNIDMTRYREDYRNFDKSRTEIQKNLRAIDQVLTVKEKTANPGRSGSPAPRAAPSPMPAPAASGRVFGSKQEVLQAKANGEIQSGQQVQTTLGTLTVP